MDWSFKKNLRYILVLFLTFFIVPHLVMSLPQFSTLDPENWTAAQGFTTVRIYWRCVWIGVPLSGGAIALWHVLKDGRFCPILALEAALAMLTYLFRIEAGLVLVLSLSVLIILLVECFTLLSRYDGIASNGIKGRILAGMAANRKFLAILCFCSVVVIGVIQIACRYTALWHEIVLPIILLPLPLIFLLLPLFQLKGRPLTMGGLVGVLILFALSALLGTTFYMNHFWRAHLLFIAVAYGMLLLVEGGVALVRRISAHRKNLKI